MKYQLKDGREIIENGKSKLRVGTLEIVPDPKDRDRAVRIFVVQEVMMASDMNKPGSIGAGALLALSFPKEKINAKEYQWKVNERTQVNFNIDLTQSERTEGADPDPAKE